MTINTENILTQCRVGAENAKQFGPHIDAAFLRFGISTKHQKAAFLAQALHESEDLSDLDEDLIYRSPERIRAVWPSRFKTVEDAVKFVRQPELLANTVYANRMGNRGPASGDGWKYRGRGIFMLTGRSNYTAAGDSLGRPYKDDPDLLAQPEDAVLTAGWFWASSGCNAMSDMAKITKRVNGGSHGLAERIAIYNRLMEMINE